MKQYLTATDIEDLAARGVREIPVGEEMVLTDVARERAVQLGMAVVSAGSSATRPPSAAMAARSVARAGGMAVTPGGKPRGCLHRHIEPEVGGVAGAGVVATGAGVGGGSVVDQLVEAVRRLNG